MPNVARIRGPVAAVVVSILFASSPVAAAPAEKGTAMLTAVGTFTVKVAPVDQEPFADGNSLGRFALDKQLHGDLQATGHGAMLTGGTPVEGSAGYVAMERVEGTLAGKKGSFLLQHLGRMSAGSQEMDIRVVPGSGTGELVGLDGRFVIEIAADRSHHYRLEYTLEPPAVKP